MERRVVDAVAVDLPDVQVLLDLGDVGRVDAVSDAPDLAVAGRRVRVAERVPEGALDEGDDAAGGLGGAAVVLAVWGEGAAKEGMG